jgi:hypothetical protein
MILMHIRHQNEEDLRFQSRSTSPRRLKISSLLKEFDSMEKTNKSSKTPNKNEIMNKSTIKFFINNNFNPKNKHKSFNRHQARM